MSFYVLFGSEFSDRCFAGVFRIVFVESLGIIISRFIFLCTFYVDQEVFRRVSISSTSLCYITPLVTMS